MSLWLFAYAGTATTTAWLMEDGFRFELENGSGFWILE